MASTLGSPFLGSPRAIDKIPTPASCFAPLPPRVPAPSVSSTSKIQVAARLCLLPLSKPTSSTSPLLPPRSTGVVPPTSLRLRCKVPIAPVSTLAAVRQRLVSLDVLCGVTVLWHAASANDDTAEQCRMRALDACTLPV